MQYLVNIITLLGWNIEFQAVYSMFVLAEIFNAMESLE